MENKNTKLQAKKEDKKEDKKETKKEETKTQIVEAQKIKPGLFQSCYQYLVKLIGLFMIGYLFVIFVLFCFQDKLLYHPTMPIQYMHQNPRGYRSPTEQGLAYKNLTLTTQDGVNIKGWFIYDDTEVMNQRPLVVFFQENAGNLGLRLPYFRALFKNLDVNILAMAYRGYSYSDKIKEPNEEGLKLDSEAIIAFLSNPPENFKKYINKQLIFLQGRSLGGAVAIHTAHKHQEIFRGLIIENTFCSISAMVDELFSFLIPVKSLVLKIGWNSDKLVPEIRIPTIYITGDQDEIVPYRQTVKLHELSTLTPFKDLLVVKDGTHNDSWERGGKSYWSKLKKFLQKCIIEYESGWTDDWGGSQEKNQELLQIQAENQAKKVKITTTNLPAGSNKKILNQEQKDKKVKTVSEHSQQPDL